MRAGMLKGHVMKAMTGQLDMLKCFLVDRVAGLQVLDDLVEQLCREGVVGWHGLKLDMQVVDERKGGESANRSLRGASPPFT